MIAISNLGYYDNEKFNPSINIYRKFSNKWVAFNKERTKVLASGKDILEVENQLSKDGKKLTK